MLLDFQKAQFISKVCCIEENASLNGDKSESLLTSLSSLNEQGCLVVTDQKIFFAAL